jgi:hypothetical protein
MKNRILISLVSLSLLLSVVGCEMSNADISDSSFEASATEESQTASSPNTSTEYEESSLPSTSNKFEESSVIIKPRPERIELTKDITQVISADSDAPYFELYYGKEFRKITDEEAQLILQQTDYWDKLVKDEAIQSRVNYISETIGQMEKQMSFASFETEGGNSYVGIDSAKDEWFLSKKPPELFSSMEELYQIQKDIFTDVTTYEDFLTKFDVFKYENGEFYVKGRVLGGRTSSMNSAGITVLAYSAYSHSNCLYDKTMAIELDGEIYMVVFIECDTQANHSLYFVERIPVPLEEVDGVLKLPRNVNWEIAFGKGR